MMSILGEIAKTYQGVRTVFWKYPKKACVKIWRSKDENCYWKWGLPQEPSALLFWRLEWGELTLIFASTWVESCCVSCWVLEPGEVRCLRMKMGHKLAVELSGFCMQKLLSPPHSSRVVWWEKGAEFTWFSSPYLHACMPWGRGLTSPQVPLPLPPLIISNRNYFIL